MDAVKGPVQEIETFPDEGVDVETVELVAGLVFEADTAKDENERRHVKEFGVFLVRRDLVRGLLFLESVCFGVENKQHLFGFFILGLTAWKEEVLLPFRHEDYFDEVVIANRVAQILRQLLEIVQA